MAFIDINCNAGTSFYSKLRAETRSALTVFLPLSCASSEKILICEKQLHPVRVLGLGPDMTNRRTTTTGRKIFVNLSLCQLHKERLKSADLKTKALRVSARHPTSDILFLMIKWQFFVCTTHWAAEVEGVRRVTAQHCTQSQLLDAASFYLLHCNSTKLNVFISSKTLLLYVAGSILLSCLCSHPSVVAG